MKEDGNIRTSLGKILRHLITFMTTSTRDYLGGYKNWLGSYIQKVIPNLVRVRQISLPIGQGRCIARWAIMKCWWLRVESIMAKLKKGSN